MKVFKKAVILSLAILTLSSSVAFGACKTEQSSDAPVGQAKSLATQQSSQGTSNGHTKANTLGQSNGN